MRRLALLLLALLAAAFVAPAANAQRTNMVRVMHASPDGPAVDVYVDGRAALTDLAFFAYSDYLALPDGTYDIAVTPAGAPISGNRSCRRLQRIARKPYSTIGLLNSPCIDWLVRREPP